MYPNLFFRKLVGLANFGKCLPVRSGKNPRRFVLGCAQFEWWLIHSSVLIHKATMY